MRVLIVGCGYVGTAVGAELAKEGHHVFGLRRTNSAAAELKPVGIEPLTGDITSLPGLQQLPRPFDWVVNTVSSTKGGAEEYRQVYLEGMRNLIAWLAPSPPQKFVYTSSTSVYGQTDGSWVEETSPTEPAAETSRLLLETERLLLGAERGQPCPRDPRHHEGTRGQGCPRSESIEESHHALAKDQSLPTSDASRHGFSGVVLRVAGIYGPERGYWLRQYLRGEATMTGRGQRILNMIHRDDVARIIIAALKRGVPGQIYNAVDDEPVAQIDLFRWLSATLDRAMPPFAAEPEDAVRKRGLTDKKVSNRKLKRELHYEFKYPTFREGFAEELRRLEREGLPQFLA